LFRTYQVLFNRLLLLLDALILILSFSFAWYIKFDSGILSSNGHLLLQSYIQAVFFGVITFLLSNYLSGLYRPMRTHSLKSEFISIVKSEIFGMLIFMSTLYFIKLEHFSRDVLFIFLILSVFLMFSERLIIRAVLRIMRAKGLNQKFILLVGSNTAVKRFINGLEFHPWFGYRIIGYLSSGEENEEDLVSLHCVGHVDDLQRVLQANLVDHVVIALPRTKPKLMVEVTEICDLQGVQSLILPDYFDLLPAKPRFESFAGMPLIDTRYVPLDDALNAFLKRTFDIVFSIFVLLFLSPVFALISILIKATSKGPIIYIQQRVGKNRHQFCMYKFRSMKIESILESGETGWSTPGDPRKTKLGKFLRRTSMDELPQFWNVLIGDMSVIGPRPERPYYVDQFKDEIPRYMVKHRVRPGITGWAQVNGWRGDTSISERIKFDIEYIENWSILLDLKIMFRTIINGFVNPHAY
jgi:Undecaprenyl-phosphate glucose phosphotransferase